MTKKPSMLSRICHYLVGAPPSHEQSETARESLLRQRSLETYSGEQHRFWSGAGTSGGGTS